MNASYTETWGHAIWAEGAKPCLQELLDRLVPGTLGARGRAPVCPAAAVETAAVPRVDPDTVRELTALWPTIADGLHCCARRYASSDVKADDLLQHALKLVLEGLRRWDRTKVTLFTFLCGVIRSEASHAARKAARRPREVELGSEGEDVPSSSPDPERLLDGAEQGALDEQRRSEFFAAVREELAGDETARATFELMLEGTRKPKEQAAAIGVSNVIIWRSRKRVLYAMQCVAQRKRLIR